MSGLLACTAAASLAFASPVFAGEVQPFLSSTGLSASEPYDMAMSQTTEGVTHMFPHIRAQQASTHVCLCTATLSVHVPHRHA